jgi:histidinol-phosphate aminotransferase
VLVVLDEAYREFVTDPDVPTAVETYGDRPNVVVLRTLSKAWGLAGLRIGYLVAQPAVATAVRKVITPFSTSSLAQAPRWPPSTRTRRWPAAPRWW